MSLAVAIWILVPSLLFLFFVWHVLLVGVRTKDTNFHSPDVRRRAPLGRIAPLVNVMAGSAVESRSGPRAT